jgi:hypothetical protein
MIVNKCGLLAFVLVTFIYLVSSEDTDGYRIPLTYAFSSDLVRKIPI